jgi:microcystin-dependent protein
MNKYFIIIGILVLFIIYLMASKCTINLDGNNYENSDYYENKDNYENYESGSSANSLLTSDINGNIKLISFPKGMIMLWSGPVSSIPQGWSLCDGNNSTPDLRGRFVVGASTSAGSGLTLRNVNDKGGYEQISLSPDQMPAHTHNLNSAYKVLAPDAYGKGLDTGNHSSVNVNYLGTLSDINSSSAGGGKPHENMPPFYALCYICYTG